MMLFGAKNPLRLVAFGLLLIALVCGCQRPLAANDPADIKALQGTWRVVAIEADLKELPADEIKQKNFLYTFKGNQLTIERKGEEAVECPFAVDNSTRPQRITIYRKDAADRAAYGIAGSRLRLCIVVDPNPRGNFPNEIACKLSPKTDLLTLEKVADNPAP